MATCGTRQVQRRRLVELAIAETNQGYANSGVNITIELAGYQPVTYTESTNFGQPYSFRNPTTTPELIA